MKQIRDLKKEALRISGLSVDHRFNQWVKWVDAIDEQKTNGYTFVGKFVDSGTVEFEVGKPRLLLVCAESGSMKYHYPYYQVLLMTSDGILTKIEGLSTDGRSPGWALRLRGQVGDWLEELARLLEE